MTLSFVVSEGSRSALCRGVPSSSSRGYGSNGRHRRASVRELLVRLRVTRIRSQRFRLVFLNGLPTTNDRLYFVRLLLVLGVRVNSVVDKIVTTPSFRNFFKGGSKESVCLFFLVTFRGTDRHMFSIGTLTT